jgi:hypothetical protein
MNEDTLPLARLLRAYMKLVHEVPVPDNATPEMIDQILEEYKKRLLTKQFNLVADSVLSRQNTPSPYRVDTDFFLPKNAFLQGKVTMLDPQNAQLQNHGDIDLLRNRFFARLKVPKARLANEQDVRTKATMGDINTAYAGTVIGYQMDTLAPIVDLVQRALFLEGYDLDRLDPSLKFLLPSPFVKDEKQRAEVEEIESRTAVNYNQIGVLSNDTIRQTFLGMSAEDSAREQEKADEEPKPPTAEFPASENKPTEAVLKELYKLRREALNGNGDHPDPSSLP